MQRVILSLVLLGVCAFAAPPQQSFSPSSSQLKIPLQSSSQRATDLDYTPIKPVTDDNRYSALHPTTKLTALSKVKHAKGNFVFSSGERIYGDKMLVNSFDDDGYTTAVDVEVEMTYKSSSAAITLTCIEIYVDTSADDASAFFIDGGISKSFASILLACNQTRTFSYEAFFYGY